jgi:hypothetical protein
VPSFFKQARVFTGQASVVSGKAIVFSSQTSVDSWQAPVMALIVSSQAFTSPRRESHLAITLYVCGGIPLGYQFGFHLWWGGLQLGLHRSKDFHYFFYLD